MARIARHLTLTGPGRGRAAGTFAAGFLVAAAFVGLALSSAAVPETGGGGYVTRFTPPTEPVHVLLLHGDGQAYASLALDPTLAHPEVFRHGPSSMAFFAHRPVWPAVLAVTTLGSEGLLTAGAVLAVGVGGGVYAMGVAAFLRALARKPVPVGLALFGFVLPGAMSDILWIDPGVLAAGLGVGAAALWIRRGAGGPWPAVALFSAAALTRESMLLLPAAVFVFELRQPPRDLRRVVPLLVAPASYVAWSLVVRVRVGTGPEDVASRASLGLPFAGLVQAAPGWAAVDIVVAALGVALIGAAARLYRRLPLVTWLTVPFAASATLLHVDVWRSWEDFSRVLLPAYLIALCGLVAARLDPLAPSRRATAPTGGLPPGTADR